MMGLRDWLQRIRTAEVQGVKPPPPAIHPRALVGGRVSRPSGISSLWPQTNTILPPPDYESDWRALQLDSLTLSRMSPSRLMTMLPDLSPEVSSGLWHFLRLCNPGWEANALRPGSDEQDVRAQAALDAFLGEMDDAHGAADVVWNRFFVAAFLRGAVFGELVMDEAGREAVDLVAPDPASVRFRLVTDARRGQIWMPGQWQGGEFVLFDRETIRYLPVDPMSGSPYGRPLASPSLFTALFLLAMMHDLRRVIQQQGYPRLDIGIDFATLAEQFPGEAANSDWTNRVTQAVMEAYAALQPDDAFVHDANITLNNSVGAIGGSLAGVDSIITSLERMAARGLKVMPLLMGMTDSGGEIQANRQWEIQAAGIKSLQHMVENLLERLLGLALQAQGMQARVEFRFAELRAAEMLRDAQTEQLRIDNANKKYQAGWISQDEASEEITGRPADMPEPRSETLGAQWQTDADLTEDRAAWITELQGARRDLERALSNGRH